MAAVDRIRAATPNERTCSAGVAEWDGEETLDGLFGRADRALYEAKAGGRNRTAFAPSPRIKPAPISAVA